MHNGTPEQKREHGRSVDPMVLLTEDGKTIDARKERVVGRKVSFSDGSVRIIGTVTDGPTIDNPKSVRVNWQDGIISWMPTTILRFERKDRAQ